MNIPTADRIAADVTAAMNALGIAGTTDQDIAERAAEAHYFWQVPTAYGQVFACLAIIDGGALFTIDVREDDEPLDRYGMVAEDTPDRITGPVLAAHLARSVTLANLGHAIAEPEGDTITGPILTVPLAVVANRVSFATGLDRTTALEFVRDATTALGIVTRPGDLVSRAAADQLAAHVTELHREHRAGA